jgi:hypothetical protein
MAAAEPATGSAVEQEHRTAVRIPVLLERQRAAVLDVDEPDPVLAH